LDFLAGLLDLIGLLFWLPRALLRLWCWLTEERSLAHVAAAKLPEMVRIRWVARLALALWLAGSLTAMVKWVDLWFDTAPHFFAGLAAFAAGPLLLAWTTGLWRDRVVARDGAAGSGA
jgi:hypothetical protein